MSKNDNVTIKQKMNQLNDLVKWFDSEEFSLETATDKFAEAEKLATEIEKDLAGFKNEITVLKERFDRAA